MKLMFAASARSMMRWESSAVVRFPKFIAPKVSGLTRMPVRPNIRYVMLVLLKDSMSYIQDISPGAARRVDRSLGRRAQRARALLGAAKRFPQPRVASPRLDQFLMRPVFDHRPVFENDDAVGMARGLQTMRNQQCRSAAREPTHGSLHLGFRGQVEVCRSLVQDQNHR